MLQRIFIALLGLQCSGQLVEEYRDAVFQLLRGGSPFRSLSDFFDAPGNQDGAVVG